MIQYQFSRSELEELVGAFQALGMDPHFRQAEIQTNWKKNVVQFHPDKAKNPQEKELFHEKFIFLTKCRDVCLEACEVENVENQIAKFQKDKTYFHDWEEDGAEIHSTVDEETRKREDEWEEFVKDQNTYFNLLDASFTSFGSFLRLTAFSILFTVGAIALSLLVITALLGMFTSLVSFPITVWIGGIVFFIWLFMTLQDFTREAEKYTLITLSKTGYPFRAFLSIWFGKNLFVILISLFWEKEIVYFLIFSNFGFWLLYHNLHPKLIEIEEALEFLRKKDKPLGVILETVKKAQNSDQWEKSSK
jgi:hypothetical protein